MSSIEIIAEVANAHQGDPKIALELAVKALDAGADAVRFSVQSADHCGHRCVCFLRARLDGDRSLETSQSGTCGRACLQCDDGVAALASLVCHQNDSPAEGRGCFEEEELHPSHCQSPELRVGSPLALCDLCMPCRVPCLEFLAVSHVVVQPCCLVSFCLEH